MKILVASLVAVTLLGISAASALPFHHHHRHHHHHHHILHPHH